MQRAPCPIAAPVDLVVPVSTIGSIPIRKAVIPAAGLGTRMLPITKVLPKALMPIGNKPLIQYAVEEAAASGIDEVVLVTSPQKTMLEDYFRRDLTLERRLQERGREDAARLLRALSSLLHVAVVQQAEPRGLGDALLCARSALGNEPFALILPDAIIDAPQPVVAQLIAAFHRRPGSYIATRTVEPHDYARFGMLAVAPVEEAADPGGALQILSIVEKPSPENAPSNYGVFGRYLLTPEVFDDLEPLMPDKDGEIHLTEALSRHCRRNTLYALPFEGQHYDAGDPVGYLQAILHFALKDPETDLMLRSHMRAILERKPHPTEVPPVFSLTD